MSSAGPYTRFHPKWYRRRVSVWWWLSSWRYTKFVLRELSSVFVAFFAGVTLWQLLALGRGPEAYGQFVGRLQSPLLIALHLISFVFVLFHAITWFNLAPKAMVVRVGGKRIPDGVIVGLNYFAWLALSGAVVWLVLRV